MLDKNIPIETSKISQASGTFTENKTKFASRRKPYSRKQQTAQSSEWLLPSPTKPVTLVQAEPYRRDLLSEMNNPK